MAAGGNITEQKPSAGVGPHLAHIFQNHPHVADGTAVRVHHAAAHDAAECGVGGGTSRHGEVTTPHAVWAGGEGEFAGGIA